MEAEWRRDGALRNAEQRMPAGPLFGADAHWRFVVRELAVDDQTVLTHQRAQRRSVVGRRILAHAVDGRHVQHDGVGPVFGLQVVLLRQGRLQPMGEFTAEGPAETGAAAAQHLQRRRVQPQQA